MRVLPRFPNMDINTNVDDVTRRINPYATEARRNKARNKFNEAQLVINCQ